MSTHKDILGPMRIPFLLLTPSCVLLGLATAVWTSHQISIFNLLAALIGALCAHISVNAFNEYFDFKSGLDQKTQRTPFSGGSGTLPENPLAAPQALKTALITLLMVAAIGIYFLFAVGPALLPLGLLGIIVIFAYTPFITRSSLLCFIAPGLGFGPLMVMGTHFVLTGTYSLTSFIASLIPFFLVSNLLLLNQFPDVDADKSIGRKHYPIRIGRKKSSIIFGAFLFFTYFTVIIGVFSGHLPKYCLLGLLTILLAIPVMVNAYRYSENIQKLIPSMGLNVMINLITPVLVAIGLFLNG